MANKTLEVIKKIEDEAQEISEKYEKQVNNYKAELDSKLSQHEALIKASINDDLKKLQEDLKKVESSAHQRLEGTIQTYQKKSQEALNSKKQSLTDYIIDRIVKKYSQV